MLIKNLVYLYNLMKTSENIIDKISKELSFDKKTIREVVNKTFKEVKQNMNKKEKIMLRGFMKFVCAQEKKTQTNKTVNEIKKYQAIKTKTK